MSGVEEWRSSQPLPGLNSFGFAIVEAPLNDVLSFLIGSFLSAEQPFDSADYVPRKFGMLYGDDARINEPFGWTRFPDETFDQLNAELPFLSIAPQKPWQVFSHYGELRVAKIRSAPHLTFIEGPEGNAGLLEAEALACHTNQPVIQFESTIASPSLKTIDGQQFFERWVTEFSQSIFVYRPDGTKRYLSISREDANWPPKDKPKWRYSVEEYGELAPFEDPEDYMARLKKDRLSREVICRQLERLGIDPEATLVRRELDEPILFVGGEQTADPVSNYSEYVDVFYEAELKAESIFG
ncbi:hypothetical protein [Pseudaestuariivita rosea]|uniref:hypothetical protein n=1 Tax=Pseudaestuariivita rosea TaxID=2763263 RepID=UPI001ABB62B3|nr:hypothetical protein [Pseudaestuariivita rosea]